MNPNNLNGSLFMKQVSKLFEDLSSKQAEKPPLNPRITCTRLRRLREIRRELVLDSDLDLGTQLISNGMVSDKSCARNKNESFADWVLRNQQSHQQMLDRQNSYREEIKNNNRPDSNKTVNGFANFSPSALQIVAQNPHTPPSTLKWLAGHYRTEVRQALAANENIDCEILNILVRDGEDSVRQAVLENKKIGRSEIMRLCEDPSPWVAEKAKKMLYQETKDGIINRQNLPVTTNINASEANPAITRAKFDNFDTQQSIVIEREFLTVLAERPTTPPRRLAELATHLDSTIRCLVAANSNATEEIFWQLARDPLPEVRMKLLDNYNCPAEIIAYLRKSM